MKRATCQTCGVLVVEAASADTGLPVVLDPRPLSRYAEVLALLDQRATFTVALLGGRFDVSRRDQFRIRGKPAGSKRVDVVVAHECYSAPLPHIESHLPLPITNSVELIDPPY